MSRFEVFHKKRCRLCDSNKLKTVYPLNPQPIGDDYVKTKIKDKNYIL